MIKEALWDGMDGWDWMVIIGHRYSKSTFNANKETFLDALASLESMLESEWVSNVFEILSILGHIIR